MAPPVAVLPVEGWLATPVLSIWLEIPVLPTGLAESEPEPEPEPEPELEPEPEPELGLGLELPMGHTVVVTVTSVVTAPTGQLVTVGLHEVIV